MKKLLDPREWIGTGIQLMIFAALLPFVAIFLGIVVKAAPEAMDKFADFVLSMLPFADPIQNAVTGSKLAGDGMSALNYFAAVVESVGGNIFSAMYAGSWLYAFRIIFKESIVAGFLKLRGLPVLQTVCGLFMAMLTYPVVYEKDITAILATAFLAILNLVLTIIFVQKPLWKKLLDLLVNFSMQSILAGLTIGYVAVLVSCLNGYYTSISQAVVAVLTVIFFMLLYLFGQYLIIEK